MSQGTASVQEVMVHLCTGYSITQMIHVVAKLGVADELIEGPKNADQIAEAVGCDSRSIYRLMRALCAFKVFSEDEDCYFELTPLGATLRSDAPERIRALAISYGSSWWWDAYSKMGSSVVSGDSAFKLAHGMELFDYLRQDDTASSIFHGNMRAHTSREALAVVQAYDFSSVKNFVDIGGGEGVLALAVAKANTALRAVVLDQPSLRKQSLATIEAAGLQARCDFLEGDFFKEISHSADLYCLKYIIHDWMDDQALTILRNCRRAMRNNAKLLIVERVLRSSNDNVSDALFDVSMMIITGGMERTEKEYRALLARAGLSVEAIYPTSTNVCIIEASALDH